MLSKEKCTEAATYCVAALNVKFYFHPEENRKSGISILTKPSKLRDNHPKFGILEKRLFVVD